MNNPILNPIPVFKRRFFGERDSDEDSPSSNLTDSDSDHRKLRSPKWTTAEEDEWYEGPSREWGGKPPPTSQEIEEAQAQAEAAARRAQRRQKRAEALEALRSRSPIEPLVNEFDETMDRLDITTALYQAATFIDEEQDREAEHYVEEAMRTAQRLGDQTALARCQYWQGRVEFLRENYEAAHRCFQACRDMVVEAPEGETVKQYSQLSRPGGLTEEERWRWGEEEQDGAQRLYGGSSRSASHASIDGFHIPAFEEEGWEHDHSPEPASPLSMGSHKPPSQGIESATEDSIPKSPSHSLPRSLPKSTPKSPTENTPSEDVNRPRRILTPKSCKRFVAGEVDRGGLQLHRSQKQFTFEMYPQEMAPRTRPTAIFPEQVNEVLSWAEKNQVLNDEQVRERGVTMHYLRREAQKYQKAVRQKKRETWRSLVRGTCTIM
ncbi:tetratricopeptide repeat protein [Aspergillus saccharolyticus JOP 1030-1]|uniref:Uncharacterized protein n=1 Tax=Aspergillus saccharolyticus JOP 1030-1 TaxID=1450539 RepID=A0A318ZBQ2_9EURO|nr:hypothetical protein BP01DRAFT_90838 [Aspergillus saccharolyticus JOP 1030-1]PYH43947.1 hypothetical protein BP01DRAFT_90838 [Aspergillus saccharolyticus JOP 1030-1]